MSAFHEQLVTAMCTRDQRPRVGVDTVVWAPRAEHAGVLRAVAHAARDLGLRAVLLEVEPRPVLRWDEPERLGGTLPTVTVAPRDLGDLRRHLRDGDVLVLAADRLARAGALDAAQQAVMQGREGPLAAVPVVTAADRARLLPPFVSRSLHLLPDDAEIGAARTAPRLHGARALLTPVGGRRVVGLPRGARARDAALRDQQRVVLEWLTTPEAHAALRPAFTAVTALARPGREQCRNAAALAATAAVLGVDDRPLLLGTMGEATALARFREEYLGRSATPPRERALFA